MALLKKTRELRQHGSIEAGKRELQDEINDALSEWADIHRSLGKKYKWKNRKDEMSSTALKFQEQWSPVFMLNHLGYRLRVATVSPAQRSERQSPGETETETPLGNWLMPLGPNILSAVMRKDGQTKG
ncbi:MAG: hypothetical protein HQM08_26760 [Candidatus Riflebacteria bacterium]|nr:hypothetical protein [Candidatus Riflebacteria bacterium]